MRIRLLLIAAVPLAAAILPTIARGDTVKATLGNSLSYESQDLDLVSPEAYTNAIIGEFDWTRTDGGTTNPPKNFNTFCIEITQNVNLGGGPYTFTTADLSTAPIPHGIYDPNGMGAIKAAFIDQLWGAHFSNDVNSVTSAAAFQVAVWEIVYDGTANTSVNGKETLNYDLTTGNFYFKNNDGPLNGPGGFSGAVMSLASAWLGGLDLLNSNIAVSQLAALTSSDVQDQVFLGSPGAPTVPLPGAAAAAVPILMLGGTTLKSKRRRQRAEDSAVA